MFLAIDSLLTQVEVSAIREAAATLAFADGRATAGKHAATVKANDQAVPSPELAAVQAMAEAALARNPLFASAARPRAVTPLILSRYRQGQTYGTHVDDALMSGLRTDLSFTLFLSDPGTYDGGALIVENTLESRAIKLTPGMPSFTRPRRFTGWSR